jgi:hypothetical protein
MADGNAGQGFILGLPEHLAGPFTQLLDGVAALSPGRNKCLHIGPFTQLLDGVAAGRTMAFIHFSKQTDIPVGVATLESRYRPLLASQSASLAILGDQTGQLLS